MAYLRISPRSPYWIAAFRVEGKQKNRSTGIRRDEPDSEAKALEIAVLWEQAANEPTRKGGLKWQVERLRRLLG